MGRIDYLRKRKRQWDDVKSPEWLAKFAPGISEQIQREIDALLPDTKKEG